MIALKIELDDPALILKIGQLAKRKKVTSEQLLKELATSATRIALGLDADLTRGEVAQRLGVCLNTVQNYLREGKFPNHYFRSAKALRIPVADVEALKKRIARHN